MKRVLKPEAEDDRWDFISSYGSEGECHCHISPPCGSCMHPGNPMQQAENESAWMEVDDDYDGVEE